MTRPPPALHEGRSARGHGSGRASRKWADRGQTISIIPIIIRYLISIISNHCSSLMARSELPFVEQNGGGQASPSGLVSLMDARCIHASKQICEIQGDTHDWRST
jgi:hypothetical protein